MTSVFSISPTKKEINIDIRKYLLSIFPDIDVVLGRVSREAPPKPPYIRYTDISTTTIATVSVRDDILGYTTEERDTLITYQVDCYGDTSEDMAQTIETLSRGCYPQSILQTCALVNRGSVTPLTFISGESQYEQRNMITLTFQVKTKVTYPLDYVDGINIKFIGIS